MLKNAFNYRAELERCFGEIMYDLKYQYYFDGNYRETDFVKENAWTRRFVSVDKENNVLGYIAYSFDSCANSAYGLSAINFTDNKAVFGMDLMIVIKEIFEKYNHSRLSFVCMADNPIIENYRKLCEKYGGREVGFYKRSACVLSGKLQDEYLFEIMKEDYLISIEKENKNIWEN